MAEPSPDAPGHPEGTPPAQGPRDHRSSGDSVAHRRGSPDYRHPHRPDNHPRQARRAGMPPTRTPHHQDHSNESPRHARPRDFPRPPQCHRHQEMYIPDIQGRQRTIEPTRQVELTVTLPAPASIDLYRIVGTSLTPLQAQANTLLQVPKVQTPRPSCRATIKCAISAQAHDTRECPQKQRQAQDPISFKCANCQGTHSAASTRCPIRIQLISRTNTPASPRARRPHTHTTANIRLRSSSSLQEPHSHNHRDNSSNKQEASPRWENYPGAGTIPSRHRSNQHQPRHTNRRRHPRQPPSRQHQSTPHRQLHPQQPPNQKPGASHPSQPHTGRQQSQQQSPRSSNY